MAPLDAAEREAWHAARSKVVGASEVAALFGVSPHTSHWALWQIKAGRAPAPDLSGDDRVQAGNFLEPAIAAWAAHKWGWSLTKMGHTMHPTVPGMGCTPDYRTAEGELVEIKNTDWIVRKRDWGDEPPAHILLQLQHQLACTGASVGWVVALEGGNNLLRWRYEARPKVIAQIEARVRAFWRSIKEGREPPVDGSDSTAATLAAMHPEARAPLADMRTDNAMPELCAGFLRAREARQAAEREEQGYANAIKAKLGDAEGAMVNGYTVKLPATPATPDRTITPDMVGQTIKGRAGFRRLTVKLFGEGGQAA